MKRIIHTMILLFSCVLFASAATGTVKVKFTGIEPGDKAILTIASNEYLDTREVEANGDYEFTGVPEGKHSVKAEADGYESIPTLTVIVNSDGSITPSEPLRVAITKQNSDPNEWSFSWREDDSPAGYTTTSQVNKPAEIEFLGKKIVPADVPSFGILQNNYNIVLADDEEKWTQEYAYRMVETIKTLPLNYNDMLPSKFTLTADHIADDITITKLDKGFEVRISKDVFYYANPFLVNLDGVRGRLFSKRLHHALTNFLTDFGHDTGRADEILWNRFGCHILNVDYSELTKGQTNEDAGRFQDFHPRELVSIINMFEEMPEGFHKIQHLNYLIRRCDGHKHPLYPEAAAVAWPVDNGYIEFMSNSFDGSYEGNNQNFETLRLILHEKTHFLWAFTFSDEIKNDWIKTGGWYQDPNAPGEDKWATTKDVEFVSAYAHAKNPDEDMAESVAFYLKDPEKLQSRSKDKYEFIRDRIMHGTRYISTIPDHLTFEVLNLWPDYDYPGKIKSVDIKVIGESDEDKQLSIEIELNHIDGYEDQASHAFTRVTSPVFYDENGKKYTQFVDVHLDPVDVSGHKLRGTANIGKHSKAGHWTTGDIVLSDLQGNQRFESRNDCVTDVYVNNPLEDLVPPKYESGSLEYILSNITVDGHPCQNLKVRYKVTDNMGISSTFARIYSEAPGFNTGGTGITDQYGTYDPETHIAEINFTITEFMPTANYYVSRIDVCDLGRTKIRVQFSDSPLDEPIKKIFITTPNPDTKAPEIDLNRIAVFAEPTHPEAPDGETKVTVNFYARDDKSGFGPCHYHFRDPQGILHGNYWYYHRNHDTMYFDGDPTVWEHYQITHILPQGSVPGIWGLGQMYVSDKASNVFTYNFVETLIFEPDDSTSDYVLFSELGEDNMLDLDLRSESGAKFGFTYRIIHEESGVEISGRSDGKPANQPRRFAASELSSGSGGASIDLSEMANGEILIIVNVIGEDGNVASIKYARVTKTNDHTGINKIEQTSDGKVNVYNLQGICLRNDVDAATWHDGLPTGLYIVNGKKILVTK